MGVTRWQSGPAVAEAERTGQERSLDGDARMPAPFAGAEPPDRMTSSADDDAHGTPGRGRTVRRWIRDIAIGVALLIAVPVATVGLGFREMPFAGRTVENRLEEMDRLRVLRHVTDGTITPLQAGEALARITPLGATADDFRAPFHGVASERLKQIVLPALPLFATARDVLPTSPLDPTKLIIAASKGVTADEAAWLERNATMALWQDADLVARAAQVDVLGGRFAQPMPSERLPWSMPIPKNADVRKLAVAGVARAAWHVTRNEWREADAALRTVVSIGFVMIDDGGSIIEALMGRAVVEIGRDGLSQLAAVRGDAELQRLTARPPQQKITRNPVSLDVLTREERSAMIAMLADVRVPHSVRMERAFLANYLQCDSMRGILFGHSAETRAQLAGVYRELARFPSEAAVLASYEPAFERMAYLVGARGVGVFLQGAANAASALTGNPRIAGCMAPITGSW